MSRLEMKVLSLNMRNSSIALLMGCVSVLGADVLSAAIPVSVQEPIEIYKDGDPAEGAKIFNATCFACHTIGKGVKVGPDLAGVHKRRGRDWLHGFIPSSTKMIKAGDADAVAIFEKFNKMVMPDQVLSTRQVDSIMAYIESVGGDAAAPKVIDMSKPIGNPKRGAALFEGRQRLRSGGPACNSCHDLQHATVMGGGNLSLDLTKAYSRLGREGLTAIMSNPPFPLMKRAFQDHPISDAEATALAAFLWEADVEAPYDGGKNWGLLLLIGGAVGTGIILVLLGFLWRGRKTTLVNAKIYDRQMGSVGVSN